MLHAIGKLNQLIETDFRQHEVHTYIRTWGDKAASCDLISNLDHEHNY
jgi:hypothetical protein